jgi:hypothetical protein
MASKPTWANALRVFNPAGFVGGKYFPEDTLQKLLTDATNNANRN